MGFSSGPDKGLTANRRNHLQSLSASFFQNRESNCFFSLYGGVGGGGGGGQVMLLFLIRTQADLNWLGGWREKGRCMWKAARRREATRFGSKSPAVRQSPASNKSTEHPCSLFYSHQRRIKKEKNAAEWKAPNLAALPLETCTHSVVDSEIGWLCCDQSWLELVEGSNRERGGADAMKGIHKANKRAVSLPVVVVVVVVVSCYWVWTRGGCAPSCQENEATRQAETWQLHQMQRRPPSH